MDYSRKISERLWNLPDKGEREMILIRLYVVLEKTTYWLKGSCKVKQ